MKRKRGKEGEEGRREGGRGDGKGRRGGVHKRSQEGVSRKKGWVRGKKRKGGKRGRAGER